MHFITIRKNAFLLEKCQDDGMDPVSEKVYRSIFCNGYNLLFHNPKTDACQKCNKFIEMKTVGNLEQQNYLLGTST